MPTLFEVVSAHADKDPDRLALLTEVDGTRCYGELVRRSAAFCAALHRLGIERGNRVCLWAANRPEWIEAYLGCSAAGVTAVGANPEWTDAEIRTVLQHSEAVAVVCDGALAARAVAVAADLPRVHQVLALPDHGIEPPFGAASYEQLIAEADSTEFVAPLAADAPADLLMYTSGTTTGRPKAVASTPQTAMHIDYQEMFGLTAADRAMVVTPFFHGNGYGAVLSALLYGASAVFPRRFSASRFWDLVDLHRPTYLYTLAPIVNILMGRSPAYRERTHALRVLVVLGAAGGAAEIERRIGAPVADWYGMTEAGMGTYTRLDEERRPGSAGRPFPGSGMAILRTDGTQAPAGEPGEVVFARSAIGFTGYLNDDEANAAALDATWFHTGDLGYFDDDGYFFFLDRKKDIVRRGGENISSMEVEAAMRSHPDVADAAVIAKPDPVLGERVVAFAVAADPAKPPAVESVRRHVAGQLARFKVPEEVFFMEELPRTATGKIEKFRLRGRLQVFSQQGNT